MIRLNDINETVIDETNIKGYGKFKDTNYYENGKIAEKEAISFQFTMGGIMVHYETQEARDKDIELLDKIFDVKSIEDKAMSVAKPELYSNEGSINEESKPVKEEDEDYVYWGDVCHLGIVKVVLPSSAECKCTYIPQINQIGISYFDNDYDAFIKDENLFNALKLKKL